MEKSCAIAPLFVITKTTVPAGTVGSCTSIIAWWNSALNGRPRDSMRVMPWQTSFTLAGAGVSRHKRY